MLSTPLPNPAFTAFPSFSKTRDWPYMYAARMFCVAGSLRSLSFGRTGARRTNGPQSGAALSSCICASFMIALWRKTAEVDAAAPCSRQKQYRNSKGNINSYSYSCVNLHNSTISCKSCLPKLKWKDGPGWAWMGSE